MQWAISHWWLNHVHAFSRLTTGFSDQCPAVGTIMIAGNSVIMPVEAGHCEIRCFEKLNCLMPRVKLDQCSRFISEYVTCKYCNKFLLRSIMLLREMQECSTKCSSTSNINFNYLLLCASSVFAHFILYLLMLRGFTQSILIHWYHKSIVVAHSVLKWQVWELRKHWTDRSVGDSHVPEINDQRCTNTSGLHPSQFNDLNAPIVFISSICFFHSLKANWRKLWSGGGWGIVAQIWLQNSWKSLVDKLNLWIKNCFYVYLLSAPAMKKKIERLCEWTLSIQQGKSHLVMSSKCHSPNIISVYCVSLCQWVEPTE